MICCVITVFSWVTKVLYLSLQCCIVYYNALLFHQIRCLPSQDCIEISQCFIIPTKCPNMLEHCSIMPSYSKAALCQCPIVPSHSSLLHHSAVLSHNNHVLYQQTALWWNHKAWQSHYYTMFCQNNVILCHKLFYCILNMPYFYIIESYMINSVFYCGITDVNYAIKVTCCVNTLAYYTIKLANNSFMGSYYVMTVAVLIIFLLLWKNMTKANYKR